MGNGESNFLYIATNSNIFAPGEHIHGEIYIKLEQSLEAKSLIIDIEGLESFEMQEKQKTFSDSNQIFHKIIILYEWNNGVAEKGDYIFPFNFKLPKDIPGSTLIELSNISACIRYRIKAYLSQEFIKEKEIIIKSKSDFSNTLQKNKASSLFRIRKLGCISKGNIEMQVHLNKFEYTCEDILRIEICGLCDDLPFVFCYLYRNVGIRADGVVKVIMSKICKVKVTEPVVDLDLKSLENRICKNTSTEGKFISCSYMIKIIASKKSCCTINNELIVIFQLNQGRNEPATPRYSIPFKPSVIRCQLIDEAYSYDEGHSFYNSNFD